MNEMAEIQVPATRVRLHFPAQVDERGAIGNEWITTKVDELVVFPSSGNARCVLRNGLVLVAKYANYVPFDMASQLKWEGIDAAKCEVCGQQFINTQGLGEHMTVKHPGERKERAIVNRK